MNLDFSNCKTKEDVDKVFQKNKKQLNLVKELPKRLSLLSDSDKKVKE